MNRLYEEHAQMRTSGCAAVLACLFVNATLRDKFGVPDIALKDCNQTGPLEDLLA